MKVLFDHPDPVFLAHGGYQIQIEQTKAALEAIGVEVEFLRWWDDRQRGDLIHYFGRPRPGYIHRAHEKQIKLVLAQILTGLGSRPAWVLPFQRALIGGARRILPGMVTGPFAWDSFQRADACVALTAWEGHLMSYMFGARPEKVHVVPNGAEEVFLHSRPDTRGPWLVCTATITPRKRVLELARAAVLARTPVWVIGRPYAESDAYAQAFRALSQAHPQLVRYQGPVQDREQLARLYRQARGFVLLSTMESLSLSALEAAACECPLLLSDLPWARSVFGERAVFCPLASPRRMAPVLRNFYDAAPTLPTPAKPLSWTEIARQLKAVYAPLLSTSP